MSWARTQLQGHGHDITGPVDQMHIRPWSTVLRIPTNGGAYYFKAPMRSLRFEAQLSHAMSRWFPSRALQPLAVDAERGWLLLPDGGHRLREIVRSSADVSSWRTILPLYARLQIDCVSRVGELLHLGVPDRRLEVLPALYETLLRDREVLRVGEAGGLIDEEVRRLHRMVPRVSAACRQLAALGIPQTINHNDIHDGNIFLGAAGPIFFDWSDSSVSHPFFSLRSTFLSVELSLGIKEALGREAELRDLYLQPWASLADPTDLREAFRLARSLWPIPSALVMHNILSHLPVSAAGPYARTIPSHLRELLEGMEEVGRED